MEAGFAWPRGWRRIPLAEAGKWLSGGTPSTSNDAYWNGDIPWISAASLKSFRIADSDRRLTRMGAANGSRLVGEGTVLFIVRGMSLKSEFRIGVTAREVAFGQDCKAVIPVEGIDPHFLAHAIQVRTPKILGMVEETSHGTGRLDTARLQALEIGVPPLAEQRRIVAAHAAFERRIAVVEKVLQKLRVAEAALVARATAGAQVRVKLGSWLHGIEAGKSPLAEDTPAGEGEWGVLKVSAVQRGWFNAVENKVVRDPTLINSRFEVRPGDLIMTRANTEDLVGLACVAHNPPGCLMLSDKTLRLIVDHSIADPEFIELVLMEPGVRRQVKAAATGTSGSMKNIGQDAIKGLLVPDVSLDDQRRTVAVRAASKARTDSLRKQLVKLRAIQQGMVEDLLGPRPVP
ncbi:Restriction endonuclease S subunits-like protein [Streptomyces sparsogenes DSM 40356]|uniref:Restriction endonuclease S subunits-like protein n=1 Tax=Streptomyces sparsogenes DSM 40356 TaxID=1331668 RepID=A0A1R1SQ57_9ACTN|nr:Restriction endonuclease S subunits-like protein [Streptomyces sparsogenes DSM 40356]